jgi:hypothetical protein
MVIPYLLKFLVPEKINPNVVWRFNNSFKNSLRWQLALIKLEWRLAVVPGAGPERRPDICLAVTFFC